jgi:hypothetical protein
MNIFCEIIDNRITIITSKNMLETLIPESFFSQEKHSDREFFLTSIETFTQENKLLTFFSRNEIFIRTNHLKEFDIKNLIDFSESLFGGTEVKVFSSKDITSIELKKLDFNTSIEYNSYYKSLKSLNPPTHLSDRSSSRKNTQKIIIVFALVCSIFLLITTPHPHYIDNKITKPEVFWWITLIITTSNFLVSIIFFKIWKAFRIMLCTFFPVAFLAIMIPTFSMVYLNETDFIQIQWFEIFLQSILWYIWNEKAVKNYLQQGV